IGQGFLYMASTMGGLAVPLPMLIGLAAAVGAVGFAINRNELELKKVTEAQDKYTAANLKAREAYDALIQSYNRGQLPSAELEDKTVGELEVARAAAQLQLDAPTLELANLQRRLAKFRADLGSGQGDASAVEDSAKHKIAELNAQI